MSLQGTSVVQLNNTYYSTETAYEYLLPNIIDLNRDNVTVEVDMDPRIENFVQFNNDTMAFRAVPNAEFIAGNYSI